MERPTQREIASWRKLQISGISFKSCNKEPSRLQNYEDENSTIPRTN